MELKLRRGVDFAFERTEEAQLAGQLVNDDPPGAHRPLSPGPGRDPHGSQGKRFRTVSESDRGGRFFGDYALDTYGLPAYIGGVANLIDITKEFGTEEACLAYLEKLRWPRGICCIRCGGERISRIRSKGRRGTVRHLYQCLEKGCRHQFTAKVGTIFNDSHLPLEKWFLAVALMCDAKKWLSALQMQRHLDVAYRTAWYLCHRIRKAMEQEGGIFGGTVEVDETFVGGPGRRGTREARPGRRLLQGTSIPHPDSEQDRPSRSDARARLSWRERLHGRMARTRYSASTAISTRRSSTRPSSGGMATYTRTPSRTSGSCSSGV
jgi:hypothetical protein